MATTHITWFGAVVEFNHLEITQVANTINTGAAGAGVVTAALLALGITGTAAIIAGAVAAVLRLGAATLTGCNSRQNGIFLYIVWVGAPWCRSR